MKPTNACKGKMINAEENKCWWLERGNHEQLKREDDKHGKKEKNYITKCMIQGV